jgi:hypothetical protein
MVLTRFSGSRESERADKTACLQSNDCEPDP